MKKSILDFAKQFEYKPVVENEASLKKHNAFMVAGMGGSGLATDIIKAAYPEFELMVRKDYGLPRGLDENFLAIINSYSGNTEEVIDVMDKAKSDGLDVSVISTNGKLIELAKSQNIPFIKMPNLGLVPRMALGLNALALAKMMGFSGLVAELNSLSSIIKPENFEKEGQLLSQKLINKVPIIYSSRRNWAVAYNWKITFNETGKIPAFCNVFPELNHNEMTGFDVKASTKGLSDNFNFIFLRDDQDDPRIIKRMEVIKKLYEERGLAVTDVSLHGSSRLERIFNSVIVAVWLAFYLAQNYDVDPETVPMVEDFKKMIE